MVVVREKAKRSNKIFVHLPNFIRLIHYSRSLVGNKQIPFWEQNQVDFIDVYLFIYPHKLNRTNVCISCLLER